MVMQRAVLAVAALVAVILLCFLLAHLSVFSSNKSRPPEPPPQNPPQDDTKAPPSSPRDRFVALSSPDLEEEEESFDDLSQTTSEDPIPAHLDDSRPSILPERRFIIQPRGLFRLSEEDYGDDPNSPKQPSKRDLPAELLREEERQERARRTRRPIV